MSNAYDFVGIGDTVTDAFIRLSQAEVLDSLDHTEKELCVTFGDKVPYDSVTIVKGVGNAANAAVSAARLGLKAALISDVGDDEYGKEMLGAISGNKVSIDFIRLHKGMESNYHYVLWYDVERTILIKHQQYPYAFPQNMEAPKWIYLTSLGESVAYHNEILGYLTKHPETKLAFQPGTFQIKAGIEVLKEVYKRTDLFFCNVEEAQKILSVKDRDIKKLMTMMAALGPKMVVITDGIEGAYAFDGKEYWFMPVYPHKPVERTGAGDAFASTVTSALILGKTLPEALSWGPINSMSVVQKIGAQEGLLPREKLEEYLKNAPADFKPKKI